MRVAFSLGANLGDRAAALAHAVAALSALPGYELFGVSPIFETDPVGVLSQPDFLNQVVVLTALEPAGAPDRVRVAAEVLAECHRIEGELHRERSERWGPRTLDVDLLAVGDLLIVEPGLTVPHPRIAERAFVLAPWADVDPGFIIPGLGAVRDLLSVLPESERAGVHRWSG